MDYEEKYKKSLDRAMNLFVTNNISATAVCKIFPELNESEEINYEKKYKKALEWMQSLYSGLHGATKEDAEHYFPELKEKESEDERIRKGLIKAVSGTQRGNTLYGTDVTREEALAWLEKQKLTDEEIIFRPIAGTDIRIAAKQALEKIDIGKKVVLAFNGAYIPVNGKTVGEIDSEYDAWLKKQGENKYAEDKTIFAKCFPELKESKDERIRKTIYGWIHTEPSEFFDNGFSKEEMLAWLEKQKGGEK